jgi:hypothetical protein
MTQTEITQQQDDEQVKSRSLKRMMENVKSDQWDYADAYAYCSDGLWISEVTAIPWENTIKWNAWKKLEN